MAASDQTYRSQKALDFVFAGTCILLLIVTIWMFVQDFQREYKQVQRDFRDVEQVMADRAVLDLAPDAEKLKQIAAAEDEVKQAREGLAKSKKEHADYVKKNFDGKSPEQLLVEKIKTDDTYRNIKADFDSLVSLYDIAVEERNAAISPSYSAQLTLEVTSLGTAVGELKKKLDKAKNDADIAKAKYAASEGPLKDAEDALGKKEDALKKMTQDFDRFAKLAEQKKWGLGDRFRSLPILDAFNSPIRIQQYVLEDLPINYSFKFVTRYDRCTTCHLGIDKGAYTQQALESLGAPKTEAQKAMRTELEKKLADAREAIKQRRDKSGGTYNVSPNDIQLTNLSLTPSQVMQYKAHPRLDLFVDGNSPHPGEKFGCTICHGGQGSATDFFNSSHTPNNSEQQAAWMREHHWHSNHYWDYPMQPNRFIESSCVKCHHEMTDLIRDGSRVEAPKLMRGYNLVKDNGCFGCHEIAGMKAGNRVGPDLRLEMSPPLEAFSPAERTKILSDPLNPPGTMRKVGPSLRRLSEKTNAEWLARWIRSPRDFRPDTKMPHFYGLSNNHPDVLPPDQKDLPDAEIQAVVYYLLTESGAYLKNQDRFRQANEFKQKELQELVKGNLATEPQIRELDEITLRLDRHGKVAPLPELPPEFNAKATPDQLRHGRELFSERGCLACHINEHTTVPMKTAGKPDLPAIHGDGQFAPNLTRIAAKLGTKPGDEASARRWLVQWILNPSFHFPRTRMPITHLTPSEANDVASWLLSQQVKDWPNAETPNVAKPDLQTLQNLATVYLSRSYTRSEVERFVKEGISAKELKDMGKPLDSDERELETTPDFAKSIENKLKMYVGKKAIGQLGCFGCHDIPGFEAAKPIGTPLNDWGKKDPERLAFEDVSAYALRNYQIVQGLTDKDGKPIMPDKPVAEGSKKTKELYEKYFFDLLEHHQREGFLYQKLSEPRSYDYQRLRAWDDRLRMPQFRFARAERREKETDEEFAARQQREESEAREAVMTFILGLVAEPPPAKFVHNPLPDRLAEIKGRQVLEKFNCGGCHLVRPGVYEFKLTDDQLEKLQANYKTASRTYNEDYFFADHNAWASSRQKQPDRIKAFGIRQEFAAREEGQPPEQTVFPSEALRFPGTDAKGKPALNDIRAFSVAMSIPALDKLLTKSDEFGGTFANLLAAYLTKKDRQIYGDDAKARPAVPPSLLRQGEKTQPIWLFSFLRDPFPIRPVTVLRMPKFNMSDEDAQAIVNYFASVTKMDNPGIGLESPYFHSPEREESYIREQTRLYIQQLGKTKVAGKDKTMLQLRLDEMQPIWEDVLRSQLVDAQSRLRGAEVSLKLAEEDEMKETDPAKKQTKAEGVKVAKATLEAAQKAVEEAQARVDKKDFTALRRTWEEKEAYLSDGFKLLANPDVCLKCHSIGSQKIQGAQGPPLELSYNRLRPDWVFKWLSYPQRFMYYATPMPTNFPNGTPGFPHIFSGTTPMQIQAARDALMNYPQVIDLPASRYRPVTVAGGAK
jgi:cytochrome c2